MTKLVYGADGRLYGISPNGVEALQATAKAAAENSVAISAKMLSVDDMAAAMPNINP